MRAAALLAVVLLPAVGLARPTVGVAPFAAATAADAWIAEGLSHGLSGRLYDLPDTNVLTVRQAAAALRALGAEPAALANSATATKLMRELGATRLVTGKLKAKGDKLTLDLQVWEGGTARLKRTVIGSRAALASLERLAAEPLAAALAAPDTAAFVAAGTTANDVAWAKLFEATALLGKQSLSPRAADPSVPPVLSEAELGRVKQLFGEAQAADPQLVVASAGLAVVLSLGGEVEAADAAAAAAKGGRGPLPTLAASFVALRKGDPDRAIAVLREAVAQQPGFLHARGTLGQLYNHYGRFREARATFTAYAEIAPELPWPRAQLGYTLAKQHKFDDAVAATQKALELAPDSPELMAELASRYIDAERLDEAKSTLERALKLAPGDARLLVRLGYVHLLRGEDTLAIQHTEKALKLLDPARQRKETAYARLNLSRAWGHLGQFDVSLEQLEAARKAGLPDCREIEADPKLARLRADARYQKAKF